jgi:ribosomal small subunit protein bTHX
MFKEISYLRPEFQKISEKMGKGDIKSKKGKLANGSFGKSRRRNETMEAKTVDVSNAAEEKPKKAAAKPKAKKA